VTRLPEGWDQSAERIAWYCAKARRGDTPALTLSARHEAAFTGIIDHIAGHGWPEGDDGPLFRAAWAAIAHEAHEAGKHVRHWSFWYEPPGVADPIGEAVTDKIGAWQVAWSLTEHQWAVVWALTEAIKRGGTWRDAAASLGMSPGAYRMTLHVARKKARALWVAPGETPPGHWARGASWRITSNTTMAGRIRNRTRQRARKAAA